MASLEEIRKKLQTVGPTVITLGNFDGVHLGHQKILSELKTSGLKSGGTPVVLILFPHPREVFSGNSPALLTTLEDRKCLIREQGIEHVSDLTFDFALSEHTVTSILNIFCERFGMKHFVMGETGHIGKNREGTPDRIREIANSMGFSFTIVRALEDSGGKISSSLIRDSIARGDLKSATKMLGRHYSTRGIVETGMGKGKGMGFPTANLGQIQTLVPVRGVYAGYAWVGGKKYKSAINVGTRPTVTDIETLVVEPHLLNFKGDIVGKFMEIQWVERLRDEKKFENVEKLRTQIELDIRKTNDIL